MCCGSNRSMTFILGRRIDGRTKLLVLQAGFGKVFACIVKDTLKPFYNVNSNQRIDVS